MSEINVAEPALSQGSATVSGMGHLLGYARVSTTDQQSQLQVDALERAGCYRVFTETASGSRGLVCPVFELWRRISAVCATAMIRCGGRGVGLTRLDTGFVPCL